ncbi:hypothetical protein NKW54_06735 [Acetobacter cerevisiae]|uniref:Uncharacterized protein n=1 Tax=Acetobacter cerevisiae TaxID=178900 RepID=A0A149UTX0_9PROT|nr:hypothetical protein [Acetobacter cerevisiae]KXV71273.1 hypothetical protein AD952_09820 [Acetobacter cerevisiae]MCP1245635.1 hypothetical protein [Acetobacter cerevisiae]MCP1255219.1 hypothetical protein [Acetobacter cerevisiae]
MLNLVIAILAFIIWSSVVIYYFRTPLMHWFDNRFGKDPVLPDLDSEEEPSASAASAPPPADKAP